MKTESTREDRLLDGLLDRLLDLPGAQRESHIQRLSATRPQLALRLRRLLALAEQDAPGLSPAGAMQGGLLEDWLDEQLAALAPGDEFCGFHIEALVGSGGMSNVYRARRDYDGFATTVALKLIHRGSAGAMPNEILRHEQRALARLEHPGIARFIDAGVGPEGDLYLAMEFVDGTAMLDYADGAKLGLRDRATLLIALCRALEHAHARRLVHGDVKSANVLVDAEQRVRLVDFGISSDAGMDANGQVRAFTPECAAPEQLAGTGITTATDVFQVGCLAYRLFAGISRLQSVRPDDQSPGVPMPPSMMLATLPADVAAALAAARGFARSGNLGKALAGDLDAIILRCLHTDPDRRYPSIAEIREDLELWLQDRCVRARPARARVRMGKFLRRNARSASVVGVVLLLSAIASAIALSRMRQAELERLAEAERAIRVERFLSETFRAASPYLRADSKDPLATIAALGAGLLGEDQALDARSRARLGLSLAQLQLARGNHVQASELLQAVESALHDDTSGVPALRAELLAARASAETEADRLDQAIAAQRDSIAQWQGADASPMMLALQRGHLGDMLRRSGQLDQAEVEFAAAMPVILADFSVTDLEQIRVLDRYVRFLGVSGRLEDLRVLQGRIAERIGTRESRGLADAELSAIQAEIDSALTDPALAATRFVQTANKFEALLGDAHPRVARAMVDACVSRLESGQMAEARALCQRGLDIYERGSADSVNSAIARFNLASIAYNSGQLRQADQLALQTADLSERHQQPYLQAHTQLLLGRIAIAQGRLDQALLRLGESRRTAPMNEATSLEIGQQSAFALIESGRLEEAAAELESIAPLLEHLLPADRARNRTWTQLAHVRLAVARGEVESVSEALESVLTSYSESPGRSDLELGWILGELAACALNAGDLSKALQLSTRALGITTSESSGVYWANARAISRAAGAPASEAEDALARDILRHHAVETQLARTFLASVPKPAGNP
jgi:serine/threonine-protein kinase